MKSKSVDLRTLWDRAAKTRKVEIASTSVPLPLPQPVTVERDAQPQQPIVESVLPATNESQVNEVNVTDLSVSIQQQQEASREVTEPEIETTEQMSPEMGSNEPNIAATEPSTFSPIRDGDDSEFESSDEAIDDIDLPPQDPGMRLPIKSYNVNERNAVIRACIARGPCQPRSHVLPIRFISGDRPKMVGRTSRQVASVYQRLRCLDGGEGASSALVARASPGRPRTGTRGRGWGRPRRDQPPTLGLESPEDRSASGDEGARQMDEGVVQTDEETGQMDEGTQQTEDNSARSTPYLRGPMRLNPPPHHEQRPLIRVVGKCGWLVLSGSLHPPRTPATVLGCLCRKHFPGLVDLGGENLEPAWSWKRYALGSDDEQANKQERVLADFWSYFKAEPGREHLADRTAHRACQKFVADMIHEARVQAHVNYYRSIKKEPLDKTGARNVTLTKEQYLQVPPPWCLSNRSAWAKIVDRYLDPAYIEKRESGKRKRALRTAPTHHQGSRNLSAFKRALEAVNPEVPVSEVGAWAVSHMSSVKSGVSFNPDAPAEAYSDPTVHAKVRDYTEAVRALRGPDIDLHTEPLETEVIVRLGQGKKHGRLWMVDSADSSASAPSLSDVRARSTGKSLPIRARPTPTLSRVNELTTELAQTKENQAHLSAQLEATKKQMADMFQIIQTIGQVSGVLVQLPAAPPVRHLTPPPSSGSNNPAIVSPTVDPINHSPSSTRPRLRSPPQ